MEKKLNESQRQIITVLRILSCMGVFAIHFSTHYGEVLPEIFNIAASFGQDGLWMFLILSGFLACCSGKNRLIDMGGGISILYWKSISHCSPCVCMAVGDLSMQPFHSEADTASGLEMAA